MGYTYILLCRNGNYYIGSTNNLKRRIKEHQTGENKSTKGKLPVKLMYFRKFKVLKQARKFEYFLKKQRNKNFYKKVIDGKIKWPYAPIV